MGIMKNHVPTIAELRPGFVTVEETESRDSVKKFFVPGGFALVKPSSTAAINATECIPIEDIDTGALPTLLADAQAAVGSAKDPKEKAKAEIAVDVYKAMQWATTQK